MLTKKDINSYAGRTPNFEDIMVSLQAAPKIPKGMINETKKVIAIARKFIEEVVAPYATELDLKMHENPEYLPWEFVKKANNYGLYTMWIPKAFGGQGYNMASMSYFVEEIGSSCLSMANLIGVHYLGVATLCAGWNTRLIDKILRDVADGEKKGEPRLISLAITEPGAGTDVEEVDLIDRGNITCKAEKKQGGYKVNGTKVFISNGHISTWHLTVAYTDLDQPSASTIMFVIKTGTEGFSFGRKEHKLGQKGCPASELIYKDCFIPDDLVAIDGDQITHLKRDSKDTIMQVIDYVVSVTRAGVAGFATGAARGAYNAAVKFANETKVNGKLLVNHEWAQCMLAEMYKNITLARYSYVETNYANGNYGFFKLLHIKPLFYYFKWAPKGFFKKVISPLLKKPLMTWGARKLMLDGQKDNEIHITSGLASLSKFAATDLAIKNCHMALEMMGQSGLRHENLAEKCLRDAKLLQIYEGTNQLNRLNLFKCLIAKDCPQVVVFDE